MPRNNTLEAVIVKFDFIRPEESLGDKLPSEITKLIKKEFPIMVPERVIDGSFKVSEKEIITQPTKELTKWVFKDPKMENSVVILPEAVAIEYRNYTSFEELNGHSELILNTFFEHFPNLQIRRIGLRYVNNIKKDEGAVTDWNGTIEPNLLSVFNFVGPNTDKISRAFHTLDMNYGEINLRFQYGMHNPDFPALLKNKSFILDYDAYVHDAYERSSEVLPMIKELHEKIKEMYSKSYIIPVSE